jgi:hypothetical protein
MWVSRVVFFSLFLAGLIFADRPAVGDDAPVSVCGSKHVCKDMSTCAEAVYYSTQCGLSDLDRDNDGVPCETICGADIPTMKLRIAAQPYSPSKLSKTAELQSNALTEHSFSCGAKRTCKQMASCPEATFYLNSCGVGSLDRDGDGVPCEGLCR